MYLKPRNTTVLRLRDAKVHETSKKWDMPKIETGLWEGNNQENEKFGQQITKLSTPQTRKSVYL